MKLLMTCLLVLILRYRANDERHYEVGPKSVGGNTDRFTLLLR